MYVFCEIKKKEKLIVTTVPHVYATHYAAVRDPFSTARY